MTHGTRDVERYFDSWMGFGPNGGKGVFNFDTGQFRRRSKNNVKNLYRGVRFITTRWDTDLEGSDLNVEWEENNSEIIEIVIKEVQNIAGRNLTWQEREEVSAIAINNIMANQTKILKVQQMMPQLTAIASQAANQVLGIVPGMFMPRVIIPPPLMKRPAVVPKPIIPKIAAHPVILNILPEKQETDLPLRKTVETPKGNAKQSLSEPGKIKGYSHEPRNVSITTYTCAIESYEPASYDYESGGATTYSINLSVINYKTEYS